jgi:uncharacterized protein
MADYPAIGLPAISLVALYAGLNGLILLWLGVHVGNVRRRLKIYMGDAGHPEMIRAMRGQLNFVELVPYSILMLLFLALLGASAVFLHLLGLALTVGRLLHAAHFSQADAPAWQRAGGAVLTVAVLAFGSLGVIVYAVAGGL